MKVYVIAVDGSDEADAAFHTAMDIMKPDDTLYLLCIAQALPAKISIQFPAALQAETTKNLKQQASNILSHYGDLCREQKFVGFSLFGGHSHHVGEVICEFAETHGADFIVMGRRGLGASGNAKRWLMGSVSRYVMEHSDANVIVVKSHGALSSIHDSLSAIVRAEEAERKRREAVGASEREGASLKEAKLAEELERARRLKEEADKDAADAANRIAAKIGVVIEEEKERTRRINEAKDKRQLSSEAARMGVVIDEEGERQRRLKEDSQHAISWVKLDPLGDLPAYYEMLSKGPAE